MKVERPATVGLRRSAALDCVVDPCPVAAVGDYVEVAFPEQRARALGVDRVAGRVELVMPATHALMIQGPGGDFVVGGHLSSDLIRPRKRRR